MLGNKVENVNVLFNWVINDDYIVGVEVLCGVQCNKGVGMFGVWGLFKLVYIGYVVIYDGCYGDVSMFKSILIWNDYKDKGSQVGNYFREIVFDMVFLIGFEWGVEYCLNVGGQWKCEVLMNSDIIGMVLVMWSGSGCISLINEVDVWVLFVEDYIVLYECFIFIVGLCWDNIENYDDNLSLCIYGVWYLLDVWMIWGGVLQGFCVFNFKQGSVGVVMQLGGNGCCSLIVEGWISCLVSVDGIIGCYMVGNLNLELEISINYELGVGFDCDGWFVLVIYFLIDFDDKIEQVLLCDILGYSFSFVNGFWWMVVQNIQKVCICGVEVSVMVFLYEWLCWIINVICMFELKNCIIGVNLLVVFKLIVNILLDWQVIDVWLFNLSVQYIGKQLVFSISFIFVKVYIIWDLVIGYDVNESLILCVGVFNLGDVFIVDEGNNYDGGVCIFFVGVIVWF